MAMTNMSTRSTTLRSFTTRVGRSFLPQKSIPHPLLAGTDWFDQIREKKTSRTRKTLPIFGSMTRWMLRLSTRSRWTKCPLWSRTYPRSFGGTRGAGNHRIFYFTFTVLFCWIKFWDAAGRNFLVNYPVTYFVLYVSLLLLFRMSEP